MGLEGRRIHSEELVLQRVGNRHPPLRRQLEQPTRQPHGGRRADFLELERLWLAGLELDLAEVGQAADLWPLFLARRAPRLEDEAELFQVAVAREQRLAAGRQQFAHHAARRPQIHGARVVDRAKQHLGGLVPPGADLTRQQATGIAPVLLRGAALQGGAVRLPRVCRGPRREARRAEVGNPQDARGAVQEQVRRLQVPMHDALEVEVRQPPEEHLQQRLDLILR
mmetsp:Transcript_34993/g.108903  ORF Transcript_34993/g.108903 Transcript_34993/m.108903 type:complete len:225 (-) Transcript_34993:358-1032(-)